MPRSTPDWVDRYVGAAIRARREELGMTLCTLADHLGLAYQQLLKYEKGHNRITAGRLLCIAEGLCCSVNAFFPELEGAEMPQPRGNRRLMNVLQAASAMKLGTLERFGELVREVAEREIMRGEGDG